MIHAVDPITSAGPLAEQMPAALRAMALALGAPPFAGLSLGTSRRLSFACNGFAALIGAAEDAPLAGMNLRSRACFLLSALSVLRSNDARSPLSVVDEAWMIAEIEADFGEALALFEARTGRPRSPVPTRPAIPRRAADGHPTTTFPARRRIEMKTTDYDSLIEDRAAALGDINQLKELVRLHDIALNLESLEKLAAAREANPPADPAPESVDPRLKSEPDVKAPVAR